MTNCQNMSLPDKHRFASLESFSELLASSLSFPKKIGTVAKFLRNADSDTDRRLLESAMECLVHLQFKHREDRQQGMIVTEDEYWAIRNIVWNIDKQIFWHAIGKRMVYHFDDTRNQWLIFSDESNRWVGFDGTGLERVAIQRPSDWVPWKRVFNDDRSPHFTWYDGAKTNLSFNSLDRYILEDPDPHYYRYWESEAWGAEEPDEVLRLNHREYLFEVTKVVMALKNMGVKRQDRVALLMPEIPEAYYLIEAFHRMGIVYTSLPTSLGEQQVSDRIDNLGVRHVFTVNGGWHKGKEVFYKKGLLDKALNDYARGDFVLALLGEFRSELSEQEFHALTRSFEKRFENRITINKSDFLEFVDTYNITEGLTVDLRSRLDAEPERVSGVVVYERLIENDAPVKTGRDTKWNEEVFMGNNRDAEILSEASKRLGGQISKKDFLDYNKVKPHEFLKIIYQFSPPAIVDADYPRLVIYTSGSTGIHKGVVHRTYGHAVFGTYTMMVTMGPRKWDLMDTRATHSWITGLDYIAGMPGLLGVESIVAEGAFDYGRWLRRLAGLKVNIAKAGAPVLRGVKGFAQSNSGGKLLSRLDFPHLRICVNCAEPADPVTQSAVNGVLGEGKYVNTWWPTELTGPNTGVGALCLPFPYLMKDDASTFPLPYVKQDVMDDDVDTEDNVIKTKPQATNKLGRYVIDPHPGMVAGIYGDSEKFSEAYFNRYWKKTGNQIWYDSGDGGIKHEDGYFHIIGRRGYAFNWNGHISGAEDVEGALREHPAVRDIMIAPIKDTKVNLDRLQVYVVLNKGYILDQTLMNAFDNFVVQKKQRTFKGLMTEGADYYAVDMYPVTMSQKSLRRFGSMLGSLTDEDISRIIHELDNPKTRRLVAGGDDGAISDIFPTKKEQNPYAGSLVGLGNYPSLVHLAYVVAETRGLISR